MRSREPITSTRVRLHGVGTRALEVGGDGPAVLLLHGFSDSADSWRPVLAELSAMGRRAVAVDLPGAGHADPLNRRSALATLDGFTEEFVRAYAGDSPAVLAGNSLSGLLTMRAARSADLPLLAAAPIAPAGLAYHRRLDLFERGVRGLSPLLWLAGSLPVPGRLVRLYAEWVYASRLLEGRADRRLARYYASHYRRMGDLSRIGGDLLVLAAASRLDPLAPAEIRVPTLLIWGSRDRLADVAGAELVLDAVPASRLVLLDDCGHLPQVERPIEVARLLADLPASAERSAPSPLNTLGLP